jgi:glycosyltransferase involved in cell wall biosynthesis
LKILELTREYYPSVGGLEKFVSDRCVLYREMGIDYSILSTDFSTEKTGETVGNERVTVLRQYTPYNIVPFLGKHLRDDYDAVSINLLGRYYSDFTIRHYRNRRQKIILTPYFSYHTDSYALLKSFIVRNLFPQLLRHVDALVVFSGCEAEYWQRECRFPAERIHIIPPYIVQSEEVSAAVDIAGPFILYLGRAGGNKKTDLLLQSFLRREEKMWGLYMTIRPQDIHESIREEVMRNPKIKLLGNISEGKKSELLSQCSGLIFPTSWESFGYVAFEASMMHKPLLCSDIPLLRELHDERGVIFFRNTEKDLTAAIERFIKLPIQELSAMGEQNFMNAQQFSSQRAAAKYDRLFSQLALR